MLLIAGMTWLALVLACWGKEFTITDQDQANILFICDNAAKSVVVSRQERANIATFCVQWEKRMQEAQVPASAPPKAETEQK